MRQTGLIFFYILCSYTVGFAQLSPGDLAQSHSHLEGMSNCTKCHVLGAKVSNEKCLACHLELKARIDIKRGYHSSSEIDNKNCITCHNDHHGKAFQLIRLAKDKFDHNLTGYTLAGAHAKKDCIACHKTEFITDNNIKNKKFTYLGLNPECLSCHTDYHQKTLGEKCTNCHGQDAFKPAVKFSHSRTAFTLTGKHHSVECIKCHKVSEREGKKFQEFKGLQFKNCIPCHSDPHRNEFGQNCIQCHTSESFHSVKGGVHFDHAKTGFPLLEKHATVACNACHRTKLTNPVKHDQCLDCHTDYHNGQFTEGGLVKDCSKCHTVGGFPGSLFTIEQHNSGSFILIGAHVATPCTECHKKQDKWSFRQVGKVCKDCHTDIHANFINQKYYEGSACENCHSNESWIDVKFDHSKTNYILSGSHARVNCGLCHFRKDASGVVVQKFAGITQNCSECHKDIHFKQFEINNTTNCSRCHVAGFWKIENFDHNRTAYKLDGKHSKVACSGCHRNISDGQNTYVLYKIKEATCESCH
jgi:hypothetical protein